MKTRLLSRRNLVIALCAAVISVAFFASLASAEIEAQEYRAVRSAFLNGTPAFRAAVASAIKDGKISRMEYRTLRRIASDDKLGLKMSDGYANAAEERVILSALARQVH